MAGNFELYKDRFKKWRWRLRAEDGRVVAVGNVFDQKEGAMAECDLVKSESEGAPIETVDA